MEIGEHDCGRGQVGANECRAFSAAIPTGSAGASALWNTRRTSMSVGGGALVAEQVHVHASTSPRSKEIREPNIGESPEVQFDARQAPAKLAAMGPTG